MATTNAERETHLNQVADDRSTWEAASNDPVMVGRLQRIGAVLVRTVGDTHFYRLRADQVVIRSGKRKMSERARIESAERLRSASRTGTLAG